MFPFQQNVHKNIPLKVFSFTLLVMDNCNLHYTQSKICIKIDTCRGKRRSIIWAVLCQYIMSLRISQTFTHLASDLMTEPQSWSCTVSYLVRHLDSPPVYLISSTHILIHLTSFLSRQVTITGHMEITHGLGPSVLIATDFLGTSTRFMLPQSQTHRPTEL